MIRIPGSCARLSRIFRDFSSFSWPAGNHPRRPTAASGHPPCGGGCAPFSSLCPVCRLSLPRPRVLCAAASSLRLGGHWRPTDPAILRAERASAAGDVVHGCLHAAARVVAPPSGRTGLIASPAVSPRPASLDVHRFSCATGKTANALCGAGLTDGAMCRGQRPKRACHSECTHQRPLRSGAGAGAREGRKEGETRNEVPTRSCGHSRLLTMLLLVLSATFRSSRCRFAVQSFPSNHQRSFPFNERTPPWEPRPTNLEALADISLARELA
jgi:hypothetical protein